MKSLKVLLAVAVVVMMASSAFAGINEGFTFGANVEINTDFKTQTTEKGAADGSDLEETEFSQGGRIEFFADHRTTLDSGFFVGLKSVFDVNDDGSFGTGNNYFEVGNAGWSMQAGRIEAESLFGYGQDIYTLTAPGHPGNYHTNYARGRDNFGGRFNFNPSDAMMVEVGAMYGNKDANNIIGARPLVKFSASGLTVKAGADYVLQTPKDADAEGDVTKLGFGGTAEYGLGAITLGASAGMGNVDTDGADKSTTLTFGGYAKMGMGAGTLGVGGRMSTLEWDKSKDESSGFDAYVSFSAPLPVSSAAVKFALAYSSATVEPASGADQENSAFGGRVRLWYEY